MFREMFQAATALPSPQGISNCPQARAMYAIDLLLEWRKNAKGLCFILIFFNSKEWILGSNDLKGIHVTAWGVVCV